MGKSPKSRKRTVAGGKFSHRPYKPRKPKAKKARSAEAILKEARAARKDLVQRGSRRPIVRAWAMAASSSAQAEPATYRSAPRPISVTPFPPTASQTTSTASRTFEPIVSPLGNPPVIASGHGQFDARPEVWAAEDFYVIIEADPDCVAPLAKQQIGFRYLLTASCFYRQSRRPHVGPHPLFIFTLEHSTALTHTSPGLLARLAGERAEPVDMAVGMFTPTARIQLGTVDFDDDFTRGRQRLLGFARHHLGISAYFDHAGFFTMGQLNPAMR